ncbi:MAG: fibrobacter succinogenes major paralogous domain-containing protein [Bacteroidetes bacterium]|nr:fibrobacter succinogenes major paralogous domain-containing protein [Bacteroidota bacterium]
MKIKLILWGLLMFPGILFSQEIRNVRFTQEGKNINIYYDLNGDTQNDYNISVYCSTDGGKTWGDPLQKVSGSVGDNTRPGAGKKISWDVLSEREKLEGQVKFRIVAKPSGFGVFTDSRDGQQYRWVKIGNQVWMGENLNYETGNSWCYENNAKHCEKYGRLYDWNVALMACPAGWHLPSDQEWQILVDFAGSDPGKKIKSQSGWINPGNGTDDYGFSALPGGYHSSSDFDDIGYNAHFWSSTKNTKDHDMPYYRKLNFDSNSVYRGEDIIYNRSLRCLRDH